MRECFVGMFFEMSSMTLHCGFVGFSLFCSGSYLLQRGFLDLGGGMLLSMGIRINI